MTYRLSYLMSAAIIKVSKALKAWVYRSYVKGTVVIPDSTRINGKAIFTKSVTLGENCHFNGIEMTGFGRVSVGNNFHSGRDCVFITSFHNYEGASVPYDHSFISKDIIIDDNVWLGRNVIVLAGARLGEGCIIQAGSVVVGEIPAMSIAGGHPAKVFKYRNSGRYLDNVKNGRFF